MPTLESSEIVCSLGVGMYPVKFAFPQHNYKNSLNCQHFIYCLLLFSNDINLCCRGGNSAPPIESLLACFLLIII